jgi:predicted adenylyl cyclase CyaB
MNCDIEYEGKILNIDVKSIREKLKKLGAVKKADYNFKRYVFDVIPKSENRWVRLRSDGISSTLTVKEIDSNLIDGTSEWEVGVTDLQTTLTILEKIGIKPRGYQENTREEYKLDDIDVSIDCWPKLAPYLEIEAKNVEQVEKMAIKLGYTKDDIIGENTSELYKDIGIDLKKMAELKFDEEK